jgi:lactoylglutathione lyase
MKIEHIALWTNQLELLKDFYTTYFGGKAGNKYINEKKAFTSYFISFASGARLEIMHKPGIPSVAGGQHAGLIHLAFSVGSKEKVDALTAQLRKDGYEISGEPRTTGDGYYESVVLDPDGNFIEITE